MYAIKLFKRLMGGLVWLIVSGLLFLYAAPWLFREGSEISLITLTICVAVWIIATGCVAIHVIQKSRPA